MNGELCYLTEFHVSLKMKQSAVALCASDEQLRRGRRKNSSIPGKNRGELNYSQLQCTGKFSIAINMYCMQALMAIYLFLISVGLLESVDSATKNKISSSQRLVASSPQQKTSKAPSKKKRGSNS